MRYFLMILLGAKSLITLAQLTTLDDKNEAFTRTVYVTGGDTLPYRLLYPVNYDARKKYPLVLFLHGNGERGNDNNRTLLRVPASLTSPSGRQTYSCFVVVPQCPKNQVWVSFPNFPNSLQTSAQLTSPAQLTLALVDQLMSRLPIDRNRLYVTGYSSGGEGTFDLLTRKPDLFAAGIPICSVGDTSRASRIASIPIWAFHGSADNVNPVIYSRLMVAALRKRGGQPKYTEYPGLGHNIVDTVYTESTLFEWLFAQKKR
ncbi:prolyl oligopeptidase family serine peptidase [Spirosoma sp. KNUC1025]|uniref:carboxylesterase family protein n=1 Tax=Spirosoma sp. KNUC1025 TaxID=2894082 RepID=UPI0038647F87|nr:prolyl oligopeptidase family serine peptidase [Spirosoma sp. KNUC1025]